jgi:glycosyltransferase involved in cell wall biosynthesis
MAAAPLLSVIICTHNPRPAYLARVLAGLQHQSLAREQWEMLVVDNASAEALAPLWDLSWHPRARHIREDELGLSAARQRGMREASAGLLVFVDDDNVLDPDYLNEALEIARSWPVLGAWSGSTIAEFEVEPAPYLRGHLGYLALREIRLPRWSNVMTCAEAEPYGAGMCVRADVADAYCRQHASTAIRLLDRRSPRDMSSGSDTEIAYVACSLGLGMGVFPNLRLTHLIPADRLGEAYLLRLMEGIATSGHVLAFKWRGEKPKSPLRGMELLRMLWNLARRRGFARRRYLAQIRGIVRARTIIAASPAARAPD